MKIKMEIEFEVTKVTSDGNVVGYTAHEAGIDNDIWLSVKDMIRNWNVSPMGRDNWIDLHEFLQMTLDEYNAYTDNIRMKVNQSVQLYTNPPRFKCPNGCGGSFHYQEDMCEQCYTFLDWSQS